MKLEGRNVRIGEGYTAPLMFAVGVSWHGFLVGCESYGPIVVSNRVYYAPGSSSFQPGLHILPVFQLASFL